MRMEADAECQGSFTDGEKWELNLWLCDIEHYKQMPWERGAFRFEMKLSGIIYKISSEVERVQ